MNPQISAQDVMTCNLCKTTNIQMHCNVCLVSLCKACVGEHISVNESSDHKIVNLQRKKSAHPYSKYKLERKFSSLSLMSDEHGHCIESEHNISEAVTFPVKQLLHKQKIVIKVNIQFKFLYGPYFLACLNDDKIWIGGADDKMYLFSISQGKILKQIGTMSGKSPGGLVITKHGDLFYTDPIAKTINIVKEGKTDTITLQNWRPFGVCTTSSGDLLVSMHSEKDERLKVVRYSGSTEKQSIRVQERTSIYEYPVHNHYSISENRNLDICLVDINEKSVIVINKDGELRFVYNGHNPSPRDNPFNPKGITTDSQGHILIADCDNDCVHIIDQKGTFLSFIVCGLMSPFGLCIDANDNLFVSEMRLNQVKKIKYLF
ncbi:uncharacterized protein LOC133195310 [Saccostrea echinata]|uniref:uncharacterized protein LOC133195310 n=1 Tax=Saccostrea echinata TaxID=191078 RepID=UPI002A7FFFDE|nr:uncharacterized protein LOC133195310 [Saccostrea echinata]